MKQTLALMALSSVLAAFGITVVTVDTQAKFQALQAARLAQVAALTK
jgi:hypothetical protein|tara:strand:- start:64 stop:204 length:141 start_codon:yes stop_codon:yes gene_type:complete